MRWALKSCEAQGHGPLRTQELRIIRTRSVVHSNAVVHKDTMRNALKICGSHGHVHSALKSYVSQGHSA
ncbi:hypothetical protein NDU88_006128 [Pleurodeles waltl]|uniref:Uncharacterized protein n=1 Tax=Pleurodeles waltl TaxID=8319 RepID=A0AAV7L515_PLEWA|nr:hypothetical protein NDU88_006128 [Pleurodeles waltl]